MEAARQTHDRADAASQTHDRADAASQTLAKWAIAAVIAGVAVTGLATLVAFSVLVLSPPEWVLAVAGIALALAAAGFAWLVARALGAGRLPAPPKDQPRSEGPPDLRAQS